MYSLNVQRHTGISNSIHSWVPKPEIERIEVNHAEFFECSSDDNGGSISCPHDHMTFVVLKSRFTRCRSPGFWGGAIYFSSKNGTSHIQHTVFYDCFANNAQSFFLSMHDGLQCNSISDSTVLSCSKSPIKSGNNGFYLDSGKQVVNHLNSTNNHLYGESTAGQFYGICPTSISWCKFINHSTETSLLIFFGGPFGDYHITQTQFIDFTKQSKLWGALSTGRQATLLMENCLIQRIKGVIFQSTGRHIKIVNCSLDKLDVDKGIKHWVLFHNVTKIPATHRPKKRNQKRNK